MSFYYDPDHDVNDRKRWSKMDIFDLTNHLRHGASIEETAKFLCRSGTVDAVRRKTEQLGLVRPAAVPSRAPKSKAPRGSRKRAGKGV
jgi:hypothetical protein